MRWRRHIRVVRGRSRAHSSLRSRQRRGPFRVMERNDISTLSGRLVAVKVDGTVIPFSDAVRAVYAAEADPSEIAAFIEQTGDPTS